MFAKENLFMKISGFYDEVTFDFEEQLKLIKELNENYICPRNVSGKNISTFTATEYNSEIKPLLEKYGVKISSIGSPFGKIGLDDEENFKKQTEQLKEMLAICVQEGIKYIRIFSFHPPKGVDIDSCHDRVVEKLKIWIEMAKEAGTVLIHENEKHICGDTDDRCVKLYKDLGCNNFKLVYDASNFVQVGVDPVAAWEKVKDGVAYVHIKDCSEYKVEVPLGMGLAKYEDVLADLKKSGYDGFLTLEPHTAKYALLKRNPLARLFLSNFRKAFKLIDKGLGIKMCKKVSRKDVFVIQYNNLKKMMEKVGV
jgi:sugar phosphate isomerase/epimerase